MISARPYPTVNHSFTETSPGVYRAVLANVTTAGSHSVVVFGAAGESVGAGAVSVTVVPGEAGAYTRPLFSST